MKYIESEREYVEIYILANQERTNEDREYLPRERGESERTNETWMQDEGLCVAT